MGSPQAIPYVNGEDAHSELNTRHTTRTSIGPPKAHWQLNRWVSCGRVCSIQCPVPIAIRHKLSASSLPEKHDGHVVRHGSR